MSEIHQRLKEKIQELEQIRKVTQHIQELNKRLAHEEKELEVMGIMLDKEQKDVELLEKEGLKAMFHKFLGDRENKLEKEREEYLRASLRFNQLFKSVELMRYELDLLSKKEQNHGSVLGQIEVLIKQREEELLRSDSETADKLKGIYEQTDKQNKYMAEIAEAIQVGKKAFDCVRGAEQHLYEAQQLGQRDMWGGRYTNLGQLKHRSIDQARALVMQSRHYLILFANELRDVFHDTPMHFEIQIEEEFSRFGDVFFDNIISDWMTQQKINKSLSNVSETRKHVERIMHQLDEERGVVKKNLELLETQRRKIIIQ